MKRLRLALSAGASRSPHAARSRRSSRRPASRFRSKPALASATPTAEQLLDPAASGRARARRRTEQASATRERRPVRPAAARRRRGAAARRRPTTPSPSDQKRTGRPAMMQAGPQGGLPGRRARHAPAPGDQVHAQGNADDRRPAADPICGRRGARGRDRADDLRHRPRQVALWSIISTSASSLKRRWSERRQEPRRARAVARRLRRDRLGPPAAAAGPRPCRLVRPPHRRRRAVRGAAARRSDGRQARLR